MNRILITTIICLLIISCKTKKEIVTKGIIESKKTQTALCLDKENDLVWDDFNIVNEDGSRTVAEFHQLLSTNNVNLNKLMLQKFITGGGVVSLPLLVNGKVECKMFELENSNTISKQKQKEIGTYSFRGFELEKTSNTVRVDFSLDTGLKVYAFIDGGAYLLAPINRNGETFYITYNKIHTTEIKQQFEIK